MRGPRTSKNLPQLGRTQMAGADIRPKTATPPNGLAPDLSGRITETLAFGASVDPAVVPPLLKSVDKALEEVQSEAERLRAQVLDPRTCEADVAGLSASTQAADIKLQRLSMARDRLAAQHTAATRRKAEAERAERRQR